jgi:large subunit ribosomal protein L54
MTVCASCRRALLSSLRRSAPSTTVLRTSIRTVATVPSTKNAASSNPPPPTAQSSTPNAISSSNPAASQPFSTPELAPQNTHKPAAADLARPPTTAKLQGSLPGGTELRGLNYIKGSPPIMTMEDNEYPDWLWTILTPKSSATDGQLAKGELAGTFAAPFCLPLLFQIPHFSLLLP